jgi:hypothetical protein
LHRFIRDLYLDGVMLGGSTQNLIYRGKIEIKWWPAYPHPSFNHKAKAFIVATPESNVLRASTTALDTMQVATSRDQGQPALLVFLAYPVYRDDEGLTRKPKQERFCDVVQELLTARNGK